VACHVQMRFRASAGIRPPARSDGKDGN
jgi:hypothetical protein